MIQDLTDNELLYTNGGSNDPYDVGYAIGNWVGKAISVYFMFRGAKATVGK